MSRWSPYPTTQLTTTQNNSHITATHNDMQVSIATGADIARLEQHATATRNEATMAQKQAANASRRIDDVADGVDKELRSVHDKLSDLRGSFTQLTNERDVSMIYAKERMLAEAECQEFLAFRLRQRAENLMPIQHNETVDRPKLRLLTESAHPRAIEARERGEEHLQPSMEEGKGEDHSHRSKLPRESPRELVVDAPKRVDTPLQSPLQQSIRGHPAEEHDTTQVESGVNSNVQHQDVPATQTSVGIATDLGHTSFENRKAWKPSAMEQMPPSGVTNSSTHRETFTWEHIHHQLRGEQYSPGLYLVKPTRPSKPALLNGRTYWLLELSFEPFAPTKPGEHGAKLTAFFNETMDNHGNAPADSDYLDVPVFVCLGGSEYTYMGTYSQTRFSDKLSHSELHQHIPKEVLEYWAETLSDKDRPQWVTEKLMEHFWPKPKYEGPFPTDSAIATPTTTVTEAGNPDTALEKRVVRSLQQYAQSLKDWRKDADMRVGLLSKDALMGSWKKPDIDVEPGLRLWWEYLQCTGYDEQLYNGLVARKKKHSSASQASKTQPSTAAGSSIGQYDLPVPAGPPELPEGKFKSTKRSTTLKATAAASPPAAEPRKTTICPWDEPRYAHGWDLSTGVGKEQLADVPQTFFRRNRRPRESVRRVRGYARFKGDEQELYQGH